MVASARSHPCADGDLVCTSKRLSLRRHTVVDWRTLTGSSKTNRRHKAVRDGDVAKVHAAPVAELLSHLLATPPCARRPWR